MQVLILMTKTIFHCRNRSLADFVWFASNHSRFRFLVWMKFKGHHPLLHGYIGLWWYQRSKVSDLEDFTEESRNQSIIWKLNLWLYFLDNKLHHWMIKPYLIKVSFGLAFKSQLSRPNAILMSFLRSWKF